jgi:hypothetical protein
MLQNVVAADGDSVAPLLKVEDEIRSYRYSSHALASGSPVSLDVINLSYDVGRRFIKSAVDAIKNVTPAVLKSSVPQVQPFVSSLLFYFVYAVLDKKLFNILRNLPRILLKLAFERIVVKLLLLWVLMQAKEGH